MRPLAVLVALAILAPTAQTPAQEKLTLRVKTSGCSEVTGTLLQDSIVLKSDLGEMSIPVAKVRAFTVAYPLISDTIDYRTSDGQNIKMRVKQTKNMRIIVETARGDRVSGTLPEPIRIETDLGTLSIEGDAIETIEILSARPAGAESAPKPAEDAPPAPATLAPKGTDSGDLKDSPPTERAARPSPIPRSILRPSATRVTRQKAPTRVPVRKLSQNAPK